LTLTYVNSVPDIENPEGDVRLEGDKAYWADYQNDPAICGFGVPWPPFGFGVGMGVVDISREEVREFGLEVDEANSAEKNFYSGGTASVKKMVPEVKKKFIAELKAPRRWTPEKRGGRRPCG